MKILSCVIVDDEPLSQDVLKKFIGDAPLLSLSGVCSDALEAYRFLQENPVDLMFLDINMPKLSGINFVRSLERPPMIIFTTAYAQYALEGFELDAVDYLLKPISFDRFLRAANKAHEYSKAMHFTDRASIKDRENEYLMIRADKKIYRIDVSEIQYIQSIGDYVKVVTKEKTILAPEILRNMEDYLKGSCIRVHKSYLVATHAIKYVEGNQVRVMDQMIPLGQKYRESFLKRFKMNSRIRRHLGSGG